MICVGSSRANGKSSCPTSYLSHATRRYLQLFLVADGLFPLYTLQARVQAASAILVRRQILMAIKEPWRCSCHNEVTSLHCSQLF